MHFQLRTLNVNFIELQTEHSQRSLLGFFWIRVIIIIGHFIILVPHFICHL